MLPNISASHRASLLLLGVAAAAAFPGTDDRTASQNDEKPVPADLREVFSGKVVLLTEALKRKEIKHYEKELAGQIVLETADGELFPIVPDWRGRALYQDERLRNRKVDLVAQRTPGVPWLQVLGIYTFDEKDGRQATDYWCDICAIPMYEIKECECCQGPIRLRFQPQPLPEGVKAYVRTRPVR